MCKEKVQDIAERFYSMIKQSNLLQDDEVKEVEKKLQKEVWQQLDSPKPKILVYGIYNSGKSTLVNAICEKSVAKVADRPMTDCIAEYDVGNYILIDSPGVDAPEEHEKIADAQLRQCHIILFVVSSKGGFESRANYQKMLDLIKMDIPFYIILNQKGDLVPGELNEVKEKIIQNLIGISGDQSIDRKYDVMTINAKRAWTGIEKHSDTLIKASGVPELRSRIETILEKDGALTWLQAPIAALDANINGIESKLYNLSGYYDYAKERQSIQAQTAKILNMASDQIRNTVYSRFDQIYAIYCGESQTSLEKTTEEIAQEVENSYKHTVYSLNQYIKEKFPRLRQREDGKFICVPANLPEEEALNFLEGLQKGMENENFFLPSKDSNKNIAGTLGAVAAGAMLANAASSAAAGTAGAAITGALGTAGAALGSTAVGSAVTGALGAAGGVLGSILPVLAPIALLGGVLSLFGSSGKKQEEEWQRLQMQVEAENNRILESVAEQARIRQDARTKTNAFLDDWAHQLCSAAKTQIETTYAAILQALDEDVLKQQQTEQKVQLLLESLHGLRQELSVLRLAN